VRRIKIVFLIASLFVPFIVAPASGQDGAKLSDELAANRYTLTITDGRLGGSGGDLLVREADQAQFFLVGEPHGIANVPRFVSALFASIRPKGYTDLAIETGPITARRLEKLVATPNGLSDFNRKYPFGLPFYNWQEEGELLLSTRGNGRSASHFWGLDQEFMASSRFHLERLFELAPNASAKAVVKKYLDQATTEFDRVVASKNPRLMLLASAKTEDFDKLDAAFLHSKNLEAREILDEMRESAEIYGNIFAGKGLESNLQRSRLMKKHFTAYFNASTRSGHPPKVLMKFGANHMKRGLNFTSVYDVGNFVSELAELHGSHSFHLLIIAAGGTQNTFVPFGSPESAKTSKIDGAKAYTFADLEPILRLAGSEPMSVIDLRALRPLISSKRIGDLPRGFADLVWGYDAVLLMSDVAASTFYPWDTK
jgi:hypothetical protein